MERWCHQDVMTWLNRLKFKDDVLKVFQDFEVEGQDLAILSDEELEAMGITSKLARLRLTVKRESHKHLSEPIVLQDETPTLAEAAPARPPRSTNENGLPLPEREQEALVRRPSTRKDEQGYELPQTLFEREDAGDYERIPAEKVQAEGVDPLAMSDSNEPLDDRDYEIIEGEGNDRSRDDNDDDDDDDEKEEGTRDGYRDGYSRSANGEGRYDGACGVIKLTANREHRSVKPSDTEQHMRHRSCDDDDEDDDGGDEDDDGETVNAGTTRHSRTGIFTATYDKLRNTLKRKKGKGGAAKGESSKCDSTGNTASAAEADKGTGTLQRMGYGTVTKTACDAGSVSSTDSTAQLQEADAAGVRAGPMAVDTATPQHSAEEPGTGQSLAKARSDSEDSEEIAVFGFGFDRLSIRRGKTGPQSDDNEEGGKNCSSSFATTWNTDLDKMEEAEDEGQEMQEQRDGEDDNAGEEEDDDEEEEEEEGSDDGKDYEMLWESTTGDENGSVKESKFMQFVHKGMAQSPPPAVVTNNTPTLRARVSSPQEMRPRAATTGAGGRRVVRRAFTAPTGELIDFSAVRRPTTSAVPRGLTGRTALSQSTDNTTSTRRMSLAAETARRARMQHQHTSHASQAMRTQRAQSMAISTTTRDWDTLPAFQQELRDSLIHQVKRARTKGGSEMASIAYSRTPLDAELCQQLAKELRMCQLVSTVVLDRCHLTAETVQQIAVALPHHSSIRKLSLEHNKIKDKGAEVLSQALRRNTSLKQLNVAHNKIGLKGARALIRATRYVFGYGEYNLSLEQVNISSNSFSKKKVKALLKDDTGHDTHFIF